MNMNDVNVSNVMVATAKQSFFAQYPQQQQGESSQRFH